MLDEALEDAPPVSVDRHAALAEEAIKRLSGFGIPLDYSPASLAGLDIYIESLAGPDGVAPFDERWAPEPHQEEQIELLGSYLGELCRRRFRGQWRSVDSSKARWISLPGGQPLDPFAPIKARFHQGRARSCLAFFEDQRRALGLGGDEPAEASTWERFAVVLRGAYQPHTALRLLDRAIELAPARSSSWILKGEIEEKLGLREDAASSFQTAILLLGETDEQAAPLRARLTALLSQPPPAPDPLPETPSQQLPSSRPIAQIRPVTQSRPSPPRPPSQALQAAPRPPSQARATAERPPSVPPSKPPSTRRVSPQELVERLPEEPSSLTPPPRPASPPGPPDPEPDDALAEPGRRIVVEDEEPTSAASLSSPGSLRLSSPPSVRLPARRVSDHPEMVLESTELVGATAIVGGLVSAALDGQNELLDALIVEASEVWSSEFDDELTAWLEAASRDTDPERKRAACMASLLVANRLAYRSGATAEDAERSLRLLERTSVELGSSLPAATRTRLSLALAAAYLDRKQGDPARNQDDALALVIAAIGGIDPQAQTDLWNKAHRLLGSIHRKRVSGQKKDNLEAAIGALKAALKPLKPSSSAEAWAQTQVELGDAYRNRLGGDRAGNVELAMQCFSAALTAVDERSAPVAWALAKQGLGQCLLERDVSDRATSIERAITALKESLLALPAGTIEAATSHYRLGLAFQRRKVGDRKENLQTAIEQYERAIPLLSPREQQSAQDNLDTARRELRGRPKSIVGGG